MDVQIAVKLNFVTKRRVKNDRQRHFHKKHTKKTPDSFRESTENTNKNLLIWPYKKKYTNVPIC